MANAIIEAAKSADNLTRNSRNEKNWLLQVQWTS